MKLKTICFTLGTMVAGAALLYAADSWTKDPSQWSSEDRSKLLNDSPWAKHVTASAPQQGGGQRGERGGRMGGMGGGAGMPGGGMGTPGGGMGGVGGYGGQGAGGYPGNEGQGGGMGRSIDATLRWESALPVQLAEQRSSGVPMNDDAKKPEAEAKAEDKAEAKPYVLMLVGLQLPRAYDQRQTTTDDDQDAQQGNRRQAARSPEGMRRQFLENTRILRKNKSALNPSDVKVDGDKGEVSFFFRRDNPIDLDDKEVTFETMVGRMKLEKKFKLKEMVYQGKLAL